MIVTITGIEKDVQQTKNDKSGTFIAHIVSYQNADGKQLSKNVFPGSSIEDDVLALSPGDNADIKTQKQGQFYNWLSVSKTDKKPEKFVPKKQFSKGGSSFDQLGMKVGNISNCASAIFAAKHTTSLKEAVDIVLDAHKYIESKLTNTPTEVKPAPIEKPVEDTWETMEVEGDEF